MYVRVALISLAILFAPCSGEATEQHISGLSTASGETAGSLVLKANQYDVSAILRVIIGHSYGIDGFHKDTSLAKAWLSPLLALQAMDAYAISALCVDLNEKSLSKNLGRSIAHCEMAAGSSMAKEIEHINLFNVEKLCREINSQKIKHKNWEKEHAEAKNIYKKILQQFSDISRLMRELRHRSANSDEQKIIDNYIQVATPSILSFYITSDVNFKKINPDLKYERLFSFVKAQSAAVEDKIVTSSFSSLISFVAFSAVNDALLKDNKEKYTQLIHDAHNGVLPAMRTIGTYYQHGVPGFPYAPQLAKAWFQFGALEADPTSILMVAISYFEDCNLTPAWAFTKIIDDFEGFDDNTKTRALQLKKTIESMIDKEKISQIGEDMIIDFMDRSEERMNWRLQFQK